MRKQKRDLRRHEANSPCFQRVFIGIVKKNVENCSFTKTSQDDDDFRKVKRVRTRFESENSRQVDLIGAPFFFYLIRCFFFVFFSSF